MKSDKQESRPKHKPRIEIIRAKNTGQLHSITIIIRALNEANYLRKVLKAIDSQNCGVNEVILVDSGSTDNTVKVARNWGARIVTIPMEPYSYGRALNIGFSYAKGDILVALSAHAIPKDSTWLEELIKQFDKPNVAATGSRVITCPRYLPRNRLRNTRHIISKLLPCDSPVLFLNTSAAYRREVWQKIQFDENLSNSEDFQWALHARTMGYRINYVPESVVMHWHADSSAIFLRRGAEMWMVSGLILLRQLLFFSNGELAEH